MATVIEEKVEPRALDRAELLELFNKLGDVGSVELKVTVPAHQRTAVADLNLDVLQGKIREVYFFDTPDLTLFQHGVVPRARRTQGGPDDTVVKLRPATLSQLAPEVQASPNLKVEMDITKGSYVVSASLKGERPAGAVREVTQGGRPLEKLFTKEQRAFFAANAPKGVGWTDLVTLGPAYVVVLKHIPSDFSRKLVIEQWHYPGEIPLVELSTKCPPGNVLPLLAETVEFLKSHGLSATGEQEPKTRKALEFFSRRPAKAAAS